ncbi:DUF456 domain-containing protein [Bacteroides sp. 519]|uniref:DUF456 domain-containing protein n=1 Tax=Bacteroides sp. 519 TaxID=2302937 RepID=UPI0013D48392|nr:DUF456 domain-containing protein [Bacteroides sp. 519]NDV58377.1 DUF456 domain-containing protein [Bacteroides sp. 519]
MDIVLIILGAICLLAGLAGCLLPILPGPPLAYIGMVLLHFTDKVQFTTTQLIIWLILVIVIQVADNFIPMLGTKKFGGTKWGIWGCLAGTLLGVILFPPWGIIIGPFAGAVIGELLGGKETQQAIRAGLGSFIGFMLGTIMKFMICGYFIYVFIRELI